MVKADSSLSSIQYACLAALVIYTSGLSFLMYASRKDKKAVYLVSTSVFIAEMLKLLISLIMEYKRIAERRVYIRVPDQDSSEKGLLSPSFETIDGKQHRLTLNGESAAGKSSLDEITALIATKDFWQLCIPAILYVFQNMLQLFAITVVSPATYQALTQVKILAASILSVWVLDRRYTFRQWASVCLLCIGVAMLGMGKVHEDQIASSTKLAISELWPLRYIERSSTKAAGILCVLLASSLGSGGAVVMEMVIKNAKASIWTRNAQLAFFSVLASGGAVLYDAMSQGRFDPLQNFGLLAWCTVAARSLGGFLIAYVLQQCDAVLKGISTSLAMILSLLVENYVFGEDPSTSCILGASLVVISSFTYVL